MKAARPFSNASPLRTLKRPEARAPQRRQARHICLTSEVETADDADDADKQELGGETGRMSPKPTPQTKPVYHPRYPRNPRFLFRFSG